MELQRHTSLHNVPSRSLPYMDGLGRHDPVCDGAVARDTIAHKRLHADGKLNVHGRKAKVDLVYFSTRHAAK